MDQTMTTGNQAHTVTAFDNELAQLERRVLEMGGLVEAQLKAAMEALMKRDAEAAERVIARDPELDACEREIEAGALSIIARRQPLANDLRYVFGNVKIAGSLERVGDYAKNIAKRTLVLSRHANIAIPAEMSALGVSALRSIRDVMDSFTTRDAQKAEMVWQHDHEIDDLVARVMRAVISGMSQDMIAKRKDPEEIECSTHLLFITKNLERVGDHATNIAEVIEFQLSGGWRTTQRPKGGDALQSK
ncbi:MAG: phosphate signaling complex protein PhoU [Rhodospirillaceae bacterium]|nr:phosphate signaling complex protein PhoU [Rhodospirillaceae bacterium]